MGVKCKLESGALGVCVLCGAGRAETVGICLAAWKTRIGFGFTRLALRKVRRLIGAIISIARAGGFTAFLPT